MSRFWQVLVWGGSVSVAVSLSDQTRPNTKHYSGAERGKGGRRGGGRGAAIHSKSLITKIKVCFSSETKKRQRAASLRGRGGREGGRGHHTRGSNTTVRPRSDPNTTPTEPTPPHRTNPPPVRENKKGGVQLKQKQRWSSSILTSWRDRPGQTGAVHTDRDRGGPEEARGEGGCLSYLQLIHLSFTEGGEFIKPRPAGVTRLLSRPLKSETRPPADTCPPAAAVCPSVRHRPTPRTATAGGGGDLMVNSLAASHMNW